MPTAIHINAQNHREELAQEPYGPPTPGPEPIWTGLSDLIGEIIKDVLRRVLIVISTILLISGLILTLGKDKAEAAILVAEESGTLLPSTWESDLRELVPDETLRALITNEVKRENPGGDLSGTPTKDVLKGFTGDGRTSEGRLVWDLGAAYRSSGLKPIRMLNGVQYLGRLYQINAEGLGLELLAMPGVPTETRIPNLLLGGNAFHIMPAKLYEKNFPTTRNAIINPNQTYYHHSGVTYVRAGESHPKTVRLEAGIHRLKEDTAAELVTEPILDQTRFEEDRSFSTAVGATVSEPDASAWTVSGFDAQSKDGVIVKMAQYSYVVQHTDVNNSPDSVSLAYFYGLGVRFLSTVKHTATATVLADFSFRKVSASTPTQGLAGAKYLLQTTDGAYVKGAAGSGNTDSDNTGSNNTAAVNPEGTLQTAAAPNEAGVMTLTTGPDGGFTVHGLPASPEGVPYTLTEIEAPAGYQLDPTPIPITVRSHDVTVEGTAGGGEGTEATVTKDSVTATADRWTQVSTQSTLDENNDWQVDYAQSGEAMTLTAQDGSEATETRAASSYGDADVFIANGGKQLTLAVEESDASWTPVNSVSRLTAGARADEAQTFSGEALDSVAQVQRAINGIIERGGMERDDDYYTVDTSVVYRDEGSIELNAFSQADGFNPVEVTVQADKHLNDASGPQPVEQGRFRFTLEPQGGAPAPLEGTTVDVDGDGTTFWTLPQLDWQTYLQSAKNDQGEATLTYRVLEEDTGEPGIVYDDTVHTLEIRMRERENEPGTGVTNGLTVSALVDGREVATGDGTRTAVILPTDSLPFTNTVQSPERLPVTGGGGILAFALIGGLLFAGGAAALIITVRRRHR